MVVVALSVPDAPVMVTVDVPTVAVELAVNVAMLEPVAGLVPNTAVTPVGNPEAARLTLPANGLTSVMEIVSMPLAPCPIDKVEADEASVKLPEVCTPLVQVVPFSVKAAGTELVTPFQVPLNPTWDMLPPAAIVPL